MSHLVALLHRDERPLCLATLAALADAIEVAADVPAQVWTCGRAGFALRRPGAAAPDALALPMVFDGRLDNRDELIDLLSIDRPRPNSLSDEALVAACYRHFGDGFANRLNGDFAVALWDGAKRELVLARDIIGVRPLYYWTSERTCIAASEIKAILAHDDVKRQPDDEGLADALLNGNPQATRLTCFRGIQRVLPGSTIIVSTDRTRERRHRELDPTIKVRCRSVAEYAERLRGLFEQAVRRRLRPGGRVAVLVSGGLDSSAILCQGARLREAGAAVAPTLGISWLFPRHPAADEARSLAAIEAQHGIAIERMSCSAIRLLDDERWLRTLEFPRLRWDIEARCLELAQAHGCMAVLDGYFGDQMMSSDAPLFDLVRRGRFLRAVREFRIVSQSMRDTPPGQLLNEYAHYFLWEVVPSAALRARRAILRRVGRDGRPRWYVRAFRDFAYQRSQQQRRARGPFASTHAELCHRHFVPTHRLNVVEESNKLAAAHGLERAYPFMDRDLVEFMMAIPGEIVNWQGVYKGLFREAMMGILPDDIRQRTCKADFTAVANDAAAAGYARFKAHFGPDCRAASYGYVDRDIFLAQFEYVQAMLTGESIQLPNQVGAVVGLEIWLRTFFGGSRDDRSTRT